MTRPGRTIGLSIAIIISVMLFTVLPLLQIAVFLMLRRHSENIEFLVDGGAVGGELSSVPDATVIIQVILGIIFFIVAILAWRGKRNSIRPIFAISVLALTAFTIIATLISLNATPSLEAGLDSSKNLENSLLQSRLAVTILVALYVIWYVNRGPARAFYRGYYLPDPDDNIESPEDTL